MLVHEPLHARGLRCVREDAAREHARVDIIWLVLDLIGAADEDI